MSIINTVLPAKVKFAGQKIDMHKGEDITPVLNQTGYKEIRVKERMVTKNHTYILNIPAGFDIETTGTDKGAFMYKWQMTFGEYLISGRTWDEWMYLMEEIQKAYKFCTEKVKMKKSTHTNVHTFILWIANQGYEYQFLCRKQWNGANIVCMDTKSETCDVFADGMRRPLKTMLSFLGDEVGAITVFDALKFSASLGSLASDYCLSSKKKTTLPDGTVVSDLDYSIPRNSMTPLNAEEEEYCDCDVTILYEWAHFYLNAYLEQNGIAPMTSTAIIRSAVVENYDATVKGLYNFNNTLNLHPDFSEYVRVMENLYRGGFTYANRAKVGKEIEDVVGKDFTSSYPAVMLQEKFPSTPFKMEKVTKEDELDKYKGKAWYADFHFKNIIITNGVSVEPAFKMREWQGSASKTAMKTGCVIDNGKIAYAKEMTVTLCEYDWDTYKKFYTWDDVEISDFMCAEKDYLPSWFTDIIKHYYKDKAKLKAEGNDGTIQYALAKAVVNGLYGLTVQKVHFDKVSFKDGEWMCKRLNYKHREDRIEMQEIYERTIGRDVNSMKKNGGRPKVVLSPYWGVWCTAIARNRILNAIDALGDDFVYCDTDSVYYEHEEEHEDFFDNWNNDVYDWNDAFLVEHEFHTLGNFDPVELDKKCKKFKYKFKTLGAKRYIKYTDEFLHATIAGLPHGSLQRRAKNVVGEDPKKQVEWMVNAFEDGMEIAADEAMKNAHKYIDEAVDDVVTDVDGNSEIMHEDSCIMIYPIEFTMKLDRDYKKIVGMTPKEIMLYAGYSRIMKDGERFYEEA